MAFSMVAQNSVSNFNIVSHESKLKNKTSDPNRQKKRRHKQKMMRTKRIVKGAISRKKIRPAQKRVSQQPKNTRSGSLSGNDQVNDQTNNTPSQSEAKGAGTFNGDLRQLPRKKPVRQERPKLREPKIKPKIYVGNTKIEPEQK